MVGFFSIIKHRTLQSVTLLSWFLLGLLPGVISWVAAHREVVAIAPLMIVLGLGFEEAFRIIKQFLPSFLKTGGFLLLGSVLFFQTLYFWQTTYSPLAEAYGFHPADTAIGNFLSQYPQAQKIYFAPIFSDTIRFLAHRPEIFVEPLFDAKELVFRNLEELAQKKIVEHTMIILPVADNLGFVSYLQQKFPTSFSFILPCVKTLFCQSAARVFVVPRRNIP